MSGDPFIAFLLGLVGGFGIIASCLLLVIAASSRTRSIHTPYARNIAESWTKRD